VELDCRSVCRKTGVSPEAEMDVVTRVQLEYSYGAGDGWTRSRVVSMPKERSGRPRLDQSCDWEKYGYDISCEHWLGVLWIDLGEAPIPLFGVDIPASSQGVRLCAKFTRSEMNDQIE